jgi:hypothetical protein
MPISDTDAYEPGEDEYGQLSFPFQVQRVELPLEPNRYSLAPDEDCPEGGGFFYENCSAIFLGRTGYGPLRMAWDTNVLIDYAEYGDLMWEEDREFDPPIEEAHYRQEIMALGTLVQLWMIRDIRVRAPERQIYDAQREMSEAQWKLRARQLHHFLAAVTCVELDKEVNEKVQPFDPLPEGSTSDEWDESLVLEAVETGCHVFLTSDRRLRRRLHRMARTSCLVILSPSELRDVLADAEELGWGGDGYFPDNHKWMHFIRATKREEQ